MRLLFAVFVVSIAALLWAAYAVARTIRKHGRQAPGSTLNLGEHRGEHEERDEP